MAEHIKKALKVAAVVFVGYALGTLGNFAKAFSTAKVVFATTLIGSLTSKGIEAVNANFGKKFTTRAPTAPRQIVYGQTRIGGILAHIETSGTDNVILHQVIVLAGHEIDSLVKVKFNDTDLTLDSGSSVSGSTVFKATNTKYKNTENENKIDANGTLVQLTFEDGSQTTANGFLTNQLSSMTADHKFKDCAYVYIQMVFDAEKFAGGIPAISFEVKGKKVYDPRSGETAFTDSTGEQIGSNPALCIRDYLSNTTYGLKATTSELNDTTNAGGFNSAATTCEQQINDIDGSAQNRYTANGFTNFSASGEGILEGLLTAMAGRLTYINGKFNVFAGATQTPSLTITDDDLLSDISVATNPNSGDLYNTVKPVYTDASSNYTAADAPVFQSSTFLSADTPSGESSANYVKQLEIRMPFTTNSSTAQRIARIKLNEQRQTQALDVLVSLKFMQLQPNDWVYLTNTRLSYASKVFEVVSTQLEVIYNDDVPVVATRLILRETANSVYSFVANDYETEIAEGSSVSTGTFAVSSPTGLSATSVVSVDITTTKINIQTSWTNATNNAIQGTEIRYGTSSGTYTGSVLVGKGETTAVIPNLNSNTTYYLVARHFSNNNIFSPYTAEVSRATGASTSAPSVPTSLAATTGNPLAVKVSWTNPSNSDLRAVKIFRHTSAITPTNDTYLVNTVAVEPGTTTSVLFGKQDGLSADTTYYFYARAINHTGLQSSFTSGVTGNFTEVEVTDIDLPDFSGYFHKEGTTTTALTNSQFNTEYGRVPLNDDILIMVNTSASPKVSKAYKYSGSSFSEISNFTTGDLVVDGTLAGSKIVAASIAASRVDTSFVSTLNLLTTSATVTNNITIGTGNNVFKAVSGVGIQLGHATFGSAPFRVTEAGVLTATNATITGQINATSGTFNGSISIGSSNNIFKADANGIYLGHATFASAPFRVTPAGVMTASAAILSGTIKAGESISAGTGTRSVNLSGSTNTDIILSAGNATPSLAPFKVKSDGSIEITNLKLFKSDGVTKMFDSATGFTNDAFSEIATDLGTAISTYSISKTGSSASDAQKITLTTSQSITVSATKPAAMTGSNNLSGTSGQNNANGQIPAKVTMVLKHSTNADLSSATTLAFLGTSASGGVTKLFSQTGTASATQYRISYFQESEAGFAFTEAITASNEGAVNANSRFSISDTATYATGDHYFFVEIGGTAGTVTTGANNVSDSAAVRSMTFSGTEFYIASDGDASDSGEGDITAVTAGTGLSGGGTAGAVTLSLTTPALPLTGGTLTGDLTIPQYLIHSGDADTFFGFSGINHIYFQAGNIRNLDLNTNGAVFNEGSADVDFRVESNSNTHMFFVDGGNGRVGIGEQSPSKTLVINENDAECVAIIKSSDTGYAGLFLGGQTDEIKGGLVVYNADNSLQIRGYNNSTKINIASNGAITFNQAYTFPTADGSANQVLQTNGSGVVSFATLNTLATDVAATITATYTFEGTSQSSWRPHLSNVSSNSWDALTFQATTEWGDSPSYGVLGGDGTEGLMLRNPHIVWNAGVAASAIRMGRSGGVSTGKWMNVGMKASNVAFLGFENTNVLTYNSATSRIYTVNGIDTPNIYNSSNSAYYIDWNAQYVRVTTNSGQSWFGMGNGSYSHFFTDASIGFYFGSTVVFDAGLKAYDAAAYAYIPIMYDFDNTAFLIDGNGTSKLNKLNVGTNASTSPIHASLNLYGTVGSGVDYRDIDIKGSWAASEAHYITFTHASSLTNMVGRIGVKYANGPGEFIVGRLYYSADTTFEAFKVRAISTTAAEASSHQYSAHIYYDAGDTTYFIEPNAVSNIYGAKAIEYRVVAGDGYGIRFWNGNTDYSHYMSAASNVTYGGRMAGETTSDYNQYFKMAAGTNRGFVFKSNTTAVAGIDAGGNLRLFGNLHVDGMTTTYLYYSAPYLGINTTHGYLLLGMGNTSYSHYTTNASSGHYFNKAIYVNGTVRNYSTGQDFRSSLYYDLDNTAYYTNPASTSFMNAVYANFHNLVPGNGNGIRFWNSGAYAIFMSASNNATYGGRVPGETTSDYNMYFKMTGGTNRGFVFKNGDAERAGIDASGNIRASGNIIAYSGSDRKLKNNLKPIEDALYKVNKLNGYHFDWNDQQTFFEEGTKDVGVIAQDVAQVLPEIIKTRTNENDVSYLALDYEKLIPLLIESIKELTTEVEVLKNKLNKE